MTLPAPSVPGKGTASRNPDRVELAEPATLALQGTIFTVHGLGRTPLSMHWLGRRLAGHGAEVVHVAYPSRRQTIEESAEDLHRQVESRLASGAPVHFVTHSLGGLVVRAYLQRHRPPSAQLGRIVMLAPPNQGSELADALKPNPIFRFATGPAGQQLGTAVDLPPHALGPINDGIEVGIIAGSVSLNPLFSAVLPGSNDGKVTVRRTSVEGMTDQLVVRHSHSFLMRSRTVAEQTLHFLAHGRFHRPAA
jgi:predicted alpha/beta hydrolase family esterase